MPTYQYHCTSCGADLEVRQHFSDPALTVCPTCSGSLRKVFNAVGVVFKGSGFYKTDSRGGSTASVAAASHHDDHHGSASSTESTESTAPSPAPAKAPATDTSTATAKAPAA